MARHQGQATLDDKQLATLDIKGESYRLRRVLPVGSRAGLAVPFSDSSELGPLASLDRLPLSNWALEYECARGGIERDEVLKQADRMLKIMRKVCKLVLPAPTTKTEFWVGKVVDTQSLNVKASCWGTG